MSNISDGLLIEKKYTDMLGQYVYNKELDKYGQVCAIRVEHMLEGGYTMMFSVYYDRFDDDSALFMSDIKDGIVKFLIVEETDMDEETEVEYNRQRLETIKEIFGDDFRDDMILYTTRGEYGESSVEGKLRNIQKLNDDFIRLDRVTANVLYDDFYARKLYLKYKHEVLTEEQFLYALVNHLANKVNEVEDSNLDYFIKYEFDNIGKESCCNG